VVSKQREGGLVAHGRWKFSLYPQAAEGGGCYVSPRMGGRKGAPDPERAQAEAARRARSKLRRYCAANRLNRLATLTYAESCRDPRQLRDDIGEFFRGLRCELGGEALPYAWASEWHPGGHGLHVHFAVGRYVGQRLIRDVWGRGIVHIKLIGDLPQGSGRLEEARVAGGYLAKYVSKSLDDERRVAGLHRYDVGRGFQPEPLRFAAESEAAVLALASEQMGGQPAKLWRSSRAEGWSRPPAVWCAWSDRAAASADSRARREVSVGAEPPVKGRGCGDFAPSSGTLPAGPSRARRR
jgi:hypothetical protein